MELGFERGESAAGEIEFGFIVVGAKVVAHESGLKCGGVEVESFGGKERLRDFGGIEAWKIRGRLGFEHGGDEGALEKLKSIDGADFEFVRIGALAGGEDGHEKFARGDAGVGDFHRLGIDVEERDVLGGEIRRDGGEDDPACGSKFGNFGGKSEARFDAARRFNEKRAGGDGGLIAIERGTGGLGAKDGILMVGIRDGCAKRGVA